MAPASVLVLVVAALLPQIDPPAAAPPSERPGTAAAVEPIAVEVGYGDRQRGFFDTLLEDEDTDRSDEEIERELRGRRWLEIVRSDGEVAIAVTRRSVSESSRSRAKDGKLSITWRYVLRAGIRTRGESDRLEATTTRSETVSEYVAKRRGREDYQDRSTFRRLADEIAARANDWILARIDELRPERPDAGFRHEAKYRWLVKGDGLEVTEVLPGSPAARAGLQVGDRIRAIDREKGTAQMDLRVKTWWIESPDGEVSLLVERNKERRELRCRILHPRQWGDGE